MSVAEVRQNMGIRDVFASLQPGLQRGRELPQCSPRECLARDRGDGACSRRSAGADRHGCNPTPLRRPTDALRFLVRRSSLRRTKADAARRSDRMRP